MRSFLIAVLMFAPCLAQGQPAEDLEPDDVGVVPAPEQEEQEEQEQEARSERRTGGGRKLHFVLEAMPGSVTFSPDAEGFTITGSRETQEVKGIASWLPNLRLGLAYETDLAYFDAMVGGGAILNDALWAPMAQGVIAARFKAGTLWDGIDVTIGPEAGAVYFAEPTWAKDVGADLSDSLGFLAGINATFGTPTVALSISADYLYSKFDVRSGSGFSASDGELDISGALLQIGVLLRF